jgi:predicted ATP-grasp superfamily ATP-dependent carboligase
MARVILTYSRGWHSLAICRSLGRQGIEVYCGEESPFAPCFFSKYCTGHFQYPSVSDDPDAFIEVLLEKVKELKPPADEPYVLMPVHKETWLIAARRELFEPHISVPLTSYENMVRTHDKGTYWLHSLEDLFSIEYVSRLWGTSKHEPWPERVAL